MQGTLGRDGCDMEATTETGMSSPPRSYRNNSHEAFAIHLDRGSAQGQTQARGFEATDMVSFPPGRLQPPPRRLSSEARFQRLKIRLASSFVR